jgi:hypothetical protein
LALLVGLGLTACAPSAEDNATTPSAGESELRKELADAMRGRSVAEAALAATRAEEAQKLAVAEKKIAELQAKVDDFKDKAAAQPVEDTEYVVVRKTSTPGTLVQSDPKFHPNDYTRTPSVFEVVFKGVQSGKEYPSLPVQESAYANLREGQTCTREEVARAKQ